MPSAARARRPDRSERSFKFTAGLFMFNRDGSKTVNLQCQASELKFGSSNSVAGPGSDQGPSLSVMAVEEETRVNPIRGRRGPAGTPFPEGPAA
eukprot:465129-Hanusia_phi.AAC.2